MASSSHYHYHREGDKDAIDTVFDDLFENTDVIPEPKERKNVFLLRETGKKATTNSGKIILVKRQHTTTVYFGAGFE